MKIKNTVSMGLVVGLFATLAPSALAVSTAGQRLASEGDGKRQGADALLGRWKAPSGEVVVEITRSGSSYVGTVVASPQHPEANGKVLFRGLTYDAGQRVWRGQVFAPKRGEFVPASIRIEREGSFTLTAGSGVFSKTITWSRAR